MKFGECKMWYACNRDNVWECVGFDDAFWFAAGPKGGAAIYYCPSENTWEYWEVSGQVKLSP